MHTNNPSIHYLVFVEIPIFKVTSKCFECQDIFFEKKPFYGKLGQTISIKMVFDRFDGNQFEGNK